MAKKIDSAVNVEEISKSLLGAMLKSEGIKETHWNLFNSEVPVIVSSGSLKMDNYLKVKTGTVIRMGGPAEVGKTSQALLFAANYMKTVPQSKTIYVNAEAKFSDEMKERSGLTYVKDAKDWNYGTVFILETNCFDTICDIIEAQYKSAVETGDHICVIIDSVDMLRLKSSMDKGIAEGRKPAGVNYLTKEMFRRLTHYITALNGLLIMITQYSATFTMDQYTKEAPNLMDGNQTHALNHQSSYALYYQPRARSHYILESEDEKPDPIKNKILGVKVRVDIRKSSTDETGYMLEIPIKKGKVGNGVWVEKELFDALFLLGLVTRNKAWIEMSDIITNWVNEYNKPIEEENAQIQKENKDRKKDDQKPLKPLLQYKPKHQGLAQFSQYFEDNPITLNWLVGKIKTLYA
jgi:RecA/RadA recombinase